VTTRIKLTRSAKKKNIKAGLSVLATFWKKGYMPKDFLAHYVLTWLAFTDGKALVAVKFMNFHRKTIQNYLGKLKLKGKAVRLRRCWNSLEDEKSSFSDRLLKFYRRQMFKTPINRSENEALANLWLTGIPIKYTMHHYVLWALDSGKDREWISKKLRFSMRHLIRMISVTADPSSRVNHWL